MRLAHQYVLCVVDYLAQPAYGAASTKSGIGFLPQLASDISIEWGSLDEWEESYQLLLHERVEPLLLDEGVGQVALSSEDSQ